MRKGENRDRRERDVVITGALISGGDCVGKRKESSLWKTMALDRHTIASLEGSHYQSMGDRGEISERTHSNDMRRQSLPTWRERASAVTKAGFFFFCLFVI